jgi:hypothetical protein
MWWRWECTAGAWRDSAVVDLAGLRAVGASAGAGLAAVGPSVVVVALGGGVGATGGEATAGPGPALGASTGGAALSGGGALCAGAGWESPSTRRPPEMT